MIEDCEIVNSVVVNLKSVVQSSKGGVALRDLENDYKLLIGSSLPLERLGFKSMDAFLQSIPDIVKINRNNGELMVEAAPDASTAHLAKLISKQKDKLSKKAPRTRMLKTTNHHHNTKYMPHQKGYVQQQQKYASYRSRQCKNNGINQINQRTSPHFLRDRTISQRKAMNASKSGQKSTPPRTNKINEKTNYMNRRTSPRFQYSSNYSQACPQNTNRSIQKSSSSYNDQSERNNKTSYINRRTSPRFQRSTKYSQMHALDSNKSTQKSVASQTDEYERNGRTTYINQRTSPRLLQKYSQNCIPHTNKFAQSSAFSHNDNYGKNRKTNYEHSEKEVHYTSYGNLIVKMKNDLADIENKQNETVNQINSNEILQIGNTSEEKLVESHIIFIRNLVRPFTMPQLKELLKKTGNLVEEKFWIDTIKSKCFAAYKSEEEAIETKNRLNGLRWPSSSPKTLIADFSTEEQLKLHKNVIPQPKSDSDNMPPMIRKEHSFLRRSSQEGLEDFNLKSNSENISPKRTSQKNTSKVIVRRSKRNSLPRFGPYAKSEYSKKDVSPKSTTLRAKNQ